MYTFSKPASFKEFCQHYGLELTDEDSISEYQKYLKHLAFTQSLFNDALDLKNG